MLNYQRVSIVKISHGYHNSFWDGFIQRIQKPSVALSHRGTDSSTRWSPVPGCPCARSPLCGVHLPRKISHHLTGFTNKSPVKTGSSKLATSVGSKKKHRYLPRIGKINSNLTNLPVIKHENENPSFVSNVPTKINQNLAATKKLSWNIMKISLRFPVGHWWQPVPSSHQQKPR